MDIEGRVLQAAALEFGYDACGPGRAPAPALAAQRLLVRGEYLTGLDEAMPRRQDEPPVVVPAAVGRGLAEQRRRVQLGRRAGSRRLALRAGNQANRQSHAVTPSGPARWSPRPGAENRREATEP